MIGRRAIGPEQKNHISPFGFGQSGVHLSYQSPADGTFAPGFKPRASGGLLSDNAREKNLEVWISLLIKQKIYSQQAY